MWSPIPLALKAYAGVGWRYSSNRILRHCRAIGTWLAKCDLTLRSGGADGCDLAFEVGCDAVLGNKEIYLAEECREMSEWAQLRKIEPRREGRTSIIHDQAFVIAERFHPRPDRLGYYAKRLMARNSHQVLGKNLDDPVDFLVCHTDQGKVQGGTAQAIRIANAYGIEVFNIAIPGEIDRLNTWVKNHVDDPHNLPILDIRDDM